MLPKDLLQFWFQGLTDETPINKNKPPASFWFVANKRFDEKIRRQFETVWRDAKEGRHSTWESSGHGRLALILVFDQFSRNMFRNTAQAFETDSQALHLSVDSIREGMDRE